MTQKRTMILLPSDTHRRLKHLAVERETSLARLVRDAVEAFMDEDGEDIRRADRILASFSPGRGLDYKVYRSKRLKSAAT